MLLVLSSVLYGAKFQKEGGVRRKTPISALTSRLYCTTNCSWCDGVGIPQYCNTPPTQILITCTRRLNQPFKMILLSAQALPSTTPPDKNVPPSAPSRRTARRVLVLLFYLRCRPG